MTRNLFLATIAGSAILAMPAFGQSTTSSGSRTTPPIITSPTTTTTTGTGTTTTDSTTGTTDDVSGTSGSGTSSNARVNSQGPANASPTGIQNASDNIVLSGTGSTASQTHRTKSNGKRRHSRRRPH